MTAESRIVIAAHDGGWTVQAQLFADDEPACRLKMELSAL